MQRRRSGDGVDIVECDPHVVLGNRRVECELVRGGVQGSLKDIGGDADDVTGRVDRTAGTGIHVPGRRVIDLYADLGQDRSDGFVDGVQLRIIEESQATALQASNRHSASSSPAGLPGRADSRLSRGVEGRGARARAASVGEPQHFRARG
jgi:hypothetical protein